jgi:acyl CoA:acetate/3-ketoacid CoA transferase alpha subunit
MAVKNLNIVSNNAGIATWELAVLLRSKQIKRVIS